LRCGHHFGCVCGRISAGCSGSAVGALLSVVRQAFWRVLSSVGSLMLGLVDWRLDGMSGLVATRVLLRVGGLRMLLLMDNTRGSLVLQVL
jgi:hypothetical protein